jgi:putative endonuclease
MGHHPPWRGRVKEHYPAAYILTNQQNRLFHIGQTDNLADRMRGYRRHTPANFIARYGVHKLVYYELFEDSSAAAARADHLKGYSHTQLCRIIRQTNPNYADLYDTLF